MKKLMMMMTVLLMVAGANAGTINWASILPDGSDYSLFTDNTAASFQGTAYLYLLTGAANTISYSGGAWNMNGATLLDTTGNEVGGGVGTFGRMPLTTADANVQAAGYYQVILLAAAGQGSLPTVLTGNWIGSTAVQLTGYSDVGGNDRDGMLAFQQGGTGFTGPTWAAVPEPTSMALLALGVAAVGLRRRLKK